MLSDGGMDAARHPYWAFSGAAGSSEHATKQLELNLQTQHMDSSVALLMREMTWSLLVLPASWHFIPRTNAVYLSAAPSTASFKISITAQGQTMGNQRIERQGVQVLSHVSST